MQKKLSKVSIFFYEIKRILCVHSAYTDMQLFCEASQSLSLFILNFTTLESLDS